MKISFREKMKDLDILLAQKKLSTTDYLMWKKVYEAQKNQIVGV
jgi:hypothetical protein